MDMFHRICDHAVAVLLSFFFLPLHTYGFVTGSTRETGDRPEATSLLAMYYKKGISFRHSSNSIETMKVGTRASPIVVVECRMTFHEFYLFVVYLTTS
jgi:hypothetical protein